MLTARGLATKKGRVAVVGGGPAGAVCAWRLAAAGIRTLLFEARPQREKPCGGGLTGRAFEVLPELGDLGLAKVVVRRWQMISPRGRAVNVALDPPIWVVARRDLDQTLRRQAVGAGAQLLETAVRELRRLDGGGWLINQERVDIVVGAGGIQDPVAAMVAAKLPRHELSLACGWLLPGRFDATIITRFYPELEGYGWFFPRPDHASLGMKVPLGRVGPGTVVRVLEDFTAQHLPGVDLSTGSPYSWPAPAATRFSQRRCGGADWLLVGDAAGLCDVGTGEGLPYALASGQLAAQAIIGGRPEIYDSLLRHQMMPELARSARFARPLCARHILIPAMALLAGSGSCRELANDLASGHQGYHGLKSRFARTLPAMLGEILR